ncbi:hypothetical protein [Bacillus sp. S/N-304-OC-R1]|uniref:hypothetical protein n=1 Tax=Bacillus sp. S/N-304-OC-R1 TaxID=2758034 RepID=UPI001C8E5971|nr:hypothetical protein [Bacillus sp. S/N-304-OC-R1]MBY0124488.1 hypothetical protein [Bacillus sp. S/N-304-OC-R1]
MPKTTYRNVRKEKYTPISNSLLWDKEASLQSKGLLSIFLSNSNDWELNMKEITKRSKNGRDAHYKIVNELIELGYFARVQVTESANNHFEEMIYIFSDIKQEVADEIENVKKWAASNGKRLIIEYKISKEKKAEINEDGPFTENQEVENQYTANQYINNTKGNKTKLNKTNINNQYIDYIDDDKRTSPPVGKDSTIHNDEYINLIISNLREATKNELRESSFKNVVRKVMDKYNQGKIKSDFRAYLVSSVSNKIEELEFRRMKDKANKELRESRKQEIANKLQNQEIKRNIPFYNWLEE